MRAGKRVSEYAMQTLIHWETPSMRDYLLVAAAVICLISSTGCTNQQPPPAAQTAQTAQPAPVPAPAAPAGQVSGDLRQVMRGILFPNANVIFYGQDKNPADVKPAK